MSQEKEGLEFPVMYLSKKLSAREQKYSTIEKEAFAVKWAIQALRYYFLGVPFTLITDHALLQRLNRMKDVNPRLTRWYLSLQPFTFEVKYRKGSAHANADYFSRQGEMLMSTEERTAHLPRGVCEQKIQSVPSSLEKTLEESKGCVVGELIKLDEEEGGTNKVVEVFLAERSKDWGEELGDWRWDDDIKEEKRRDREVQPGVEREVQTDETGEERERIVKLVKSFPNLTKEDALLPMPPELKRIGWGEQKKGWIREVGSITPLLEHHKTPYGVSPYLPRLEGSVVKHPCCATTCVVLSASLWNTNPTSLFGVKKM